MYRYFGDAFQSVWLAVEALDFTDYPGSLTNSTVLGHMVQISLVRPVSNSVI